MISMMEGIFRLYYQAKLLREISYEFSLLKAFKLEANFDNLSSITSSEKPNSRIIIAAETNCN